MNVRFALLVVAVVAALSAVLVAASDVHVEHSLITYTRDGTFSKHVTKIKATVSSKKGGEQATGTVLFFHGFADCKDNHAKLFQGWVAEGLRVVAFDFPGHGSSTGSINDFRMRDLSKIGRKVLDKVGLVGDLFLAGWSTGGLAVVREVQKFGALPSPKAVFLIAPGVVVKPLVGKYGTVTKETISSNPEPAVCPIKPTSPMKVFFFASSLLSESLLSVASPWPKDIPTLVFTAGHDKYVLTEGVNEWVEHHKSIIGVTCANSFHEMDNEPVPVGHTVREAAAAFFKNPSGYKFTPKGGCVRILDD